MKNVAFLLLSLLSFTYPAESGFSSASGPLLFKPLSANTFEPRIGLIWHANNNRLRLDIGNSVDMVQYAIEGQKKKLTLGSDFFTYTQLRGEKNFHFPVDAVDYLFGFNVNYIDSMGNGILSSRLRLSHISAHFVDGHFDGTTGQWKDATNPRVYSREFFDLAISYEPERSLRLYIGTLYLWHLDPTTLPKFLVYAGSEAHLDLFAAVQGYAAYQFTATGVRPRHEFQAGTKIGNWSGRGIKLFFTYYSGNSIHGEYYDRNDKYSGVGFNIDF